MIVIADFYFVFIPYLTVKTSQPVISAKLHSILAAESGKCTVGAGVSLKHIKLKETLTP